MIDTVRPWVVSHWPGSVAVLTALGLTADVLSKKGMLASGFGVGCLAAAGWTLLLSGQAPFSRSIVWFTIFSCLGSVALGAWTGDVLTTRQWAGVAVALLAVWLLT